MGVAFVLVSAARYMENEREKRRYEEEKAEIQTPPPNIYEVETMSRPQMRRYTAELKPWMEADVPAEIAGRVVAVLVEPGTEVREGDPMVRLDERFAELAVDLARTRYNEATRLREESEQLLKSNVASRTQYDAAVAEERSAMASLADVTERLLRHTIRAPFTGIVNARLVDVGEAIKLNEPVVTLVDLQRLRVVFFVAEDELDAFAKGTPLSLRVQAKPGLKLEPSVDFVSRSADDRSRLFRVEGVLDNTEMGLPGGLQGVVEAEVDFFKDKPFIPASGVRFAGRTATVLKMGGEEPSIAEVEVGPELDGYYPVFSGLNVGDEILVR